MRGSEMKELQTLDSHPDLSWSDRIALFAYAMSQQPDAKQSDDDAFKLKHMFRGDWYIREMSLPEGFVFVGRIHKQGHMVKLIDGSVSVRTEHSLIQHFAPDVLHTVPGFQMVVYAHVNIVAQSWHHNPSHCRDIAALENEFFVDPQLVLDRGAQLSKEKLTWQAE